MLPERLEVNASAELTEFAGHLFVQEAVAERHLCLVIDQRARRRDSQGDQRVSIPAIPYLLALGLARPDLIL